MTHLTKFWLFSLCCSLLACSTTPPREIQRPPEAPLSFSPKPERVRLIAVGDTGYPGGPQEDISKAITAEPDKDAVIILGDLIYRSGPRCPTGYIQGDALEVMNERLGDPFRDMGAPVLLVLGNHDVAGNGRDIARESCFLDFAQKEPNFYLNGLTYKVDIGDTRVVVINTNKLTAKDAKLARGWVDEAKGPVVIAGHHTLKTYGDKEDEDYVMPWFKEHGLRPDIYLNGHAHLLQAGIYGGIFNLTSGAGAKLRSGPTCPTECGPDQLWGVSSYGYAVVDIEPHQIKVQFKDRHGAKLWEKTHKITPRKPVGKSP